MLQLFSPRARFGAWRELWIALAKAEHELGLPVTQEQIAELEEVRDDFDFERVAEGRYELPPPINLKGLVGK